MALWILYALIFLAVLSAAEGILLLVSGDPTVRRKTVQQRLLRHASRVVDPLDGPLGGGILIDENANQAPLTRLFKRFSWKRDLDLILYRAGMPFTIPQFFALTLLLGIGGFFVGLLLLESWWLAALLSASGVLPLASVLVKKHQRMGRFETQMPEALDLICRALRAGISLEFGFRSVGDELPDPIATEFAHVADEISLGLDTRVALQNLATRMGTGDMPFFVNAILIQRETGGNLAEVLDNLAHIIRERIKFHGKVRALVAQVNLTANLLALMPLVFAGGMYVISPGFLDPILEPPGIYFLYGTGISVPVGWLLCRRIASVSS